MSQAHSQSTTTTISNDSSVLNKSATITTTTATIATTNVSNLSSNLEEEQQRKNVVIQLTPTSSIRNIRNINNRLTTSTTTINTTNSLNTAATTTTPQVLSSSAPRIVLSLSDSINVSTSSIQQQLPNTKVITLQTASGQQIKLQQLRQFQLPQGSSSSSSSSPSTTTSVVPTSINLVPVSTTGNAINVINTQQPQLITQAGLQTLLAKQQKNQSTSSSDGIAPQGSTKKNVDVFNVLLYNNNNNNNNTPRFTPKASNDATMGNCRLCGTYGARETFFGKGKLFCSMACARNAEAAQQHVSSSQSSSSSSNITTTTTVTPKPTSYKVYKVAMPISTSSIIPKTNPNQSSKEDLAHQPQQQRKLQTTSSVEQQTDPSTIGMVSTPSTMLNSLAPLNSTVATTSTVRPLNRFIIRNSTTQNQLSAAGTIRQIISDRSPGSHHHQYRLQTSAASLQQKSPSLVIQQQQQPQSIDPSSPKDSNIKRSYSKMISLANPHLHQLPTSTNNIVQQQIQLTNTNNSTLVAVNLNNGSGMQQQQLATTTPKRVKKNQQQNGGQNTSTTLTTLTNTGVKRSRSKSNSSTSSTQSGTFVDGYNIKNEFNNEDTNAFVASGSGGSSGLVSNTNPPNTNSILISQLNKPAMLGPRTSETETTPSPGTILTTNQSIQTNSSPLIVQLASNNNQQLSRSIATIKSNQQLQQFINQNPSFRIATAVQQGGATLKTAMPIPIPIRATTANVITSTNNNNTTMVPTDPSRFCQLFQINQQQQQVINNNNTNNQSLSTPVIAKQNNLPDHHQSQHSQQHLHQNHPQQPQLQHQQNDSLAKMLMNKPTLTKPKPEAMASSSSVASIPSVVPVPKPLSKSEEIVVLETAVMSSLNHNISNNTSIFSPNNTNSISGTQNNFTRANFVNSNSINMVNSSNISSHYPPIWWLILDKFGYDRCAPVSAFPNSPLRKLWPTVIGMDGLNDNNNSDVVNEGQKCSFEIRLSDQDVLVNGMTQVGNITPNKSKSKKNSFDFVTTTMSSIESQNDKFWFVKIVGHSGYYLRCRYVGLENSNRYDFWVNIRHRNLYPMSYAKNHNYGYKPPREVVEMNPNYMVEVRRFLQPSQKYIKTDLYTLFLEQLQTDLKPGLKVESIDIKRPNTYRIATISQVIGQRCFLRYDGEIFKDEQNGLWTHIHSEHIRPVGWSLLVGNKLFASEEYAKKSIIRAIENVNHHFESNNNRLNWNKLGVLKKFEFIDENSVFKEGMKLEVVNPWDISLICVATVRKVLRFNFIVLSIDDWSRDHQPYSNFENNLLSPVQQTSSNYYNQLDLEDRMFCMHASSPYLLPAGFCSAFGIKLTPPEDYKPVFNWIDYLNKTNSLMAPINFFSFEHFNKDCASSKTKTNDYDENRFVCRFEVGQLLEAVDMVKPDSICVAVIKKIAGRLLLIHFIGWDEIHDQWCDCCSPNIFPVGYCDLIDYPLEGPPSPNKKKRNNSQSSKRNKTFIASPKARSYRGQSKALSSSTTSVTENAKENENDSFSGSSNDGKHQKMDMMDYNQDHCNGNMSNSDDNNQDDVDNNDHNKNDLINNPKNPDNDDHTDGDNNDDSNSDVWLQALNREQTELYNFLSWNESITNRGLLKDYNLFTSPLLSKMNLGNGHVVKFNNLLLNQNRFNIKLVHDKFNFDVEIEWNPNTFKQMTIVEEEDDDDINIDNGYNEQYNHQNRMIDQKGGKVKIYDSYQFFNPEDDGADGSNDLRMLPHWSSKQVSKFMYRNGFADLCDSLLVYNIDGKRLLSLTKTQALHIALTPSATDRFLSFINLLKKQFSRD